MCAAASKFRTTTALDLDASTPELAAYPMPKFDDLDTFVQSISGNHALMINLAYLVNGLRSDREYNSVLRQIKSIKALEHAYPQAYTKQLNERADRYAVIAMGDLIYVCVYVIYAKHNSLTARLYVELAEGMIDHAFNIMKNDHLTDTRSSADVSADIKKELADFHIRVYNVLYAHGIST